MKKIKVAFYLPFYSHECESRHARMHDILHALVRMDDVPFEFVVLAERGRGAEKEKRVSYSKFPFLKRYTETYTQAPSASNSSDNKCESVSAPPKLKFQDPIPADGLVEHYLIDHSNGRVGEGGVVPENLERSFLRKLCGLVLRILRRSYRKLVRLVRKIFQKGRRTVLRLYRSFQRLKGYFKLFRSGTAHKLVWKWCRTDILRRAQKIEKIDVLHIIRPNMVSDELERIFAEKNPNLKVIVGPNLMAYGHPSNAFNYADFENKPLSKVVAISSFHQTLLEDFGFSNSLLTRLPPTVDSTYFHPTDSRKQKKNSGQYVLLFAASQLAKEKGINVFLEAFAKISEQRPGCFKAIIAGGKQVNSLTQTPMDENLLTADLVENIEFVGKKKRAEMADLYRAADAFVHCGEPENGPTTIIESIACGSECVLPDHLCFREPEFEGAVQYYSPGDLGDLVEKILNLQARQGCVSERLLRAQKSIDHENSIRFLSDLYQEVCSNELV